MYGLNTIRIPVGYWIKEDIVYSDSEHFPQGGLSYLEQVCGWASDAGFYIIIDLHGAPGAQVPKNADTGQVRRLLCLVVSCLSNSCSTLPPLASTSTTSMNALSSSSSG